MRLLCYTRIFPLFVMMSLFLFASPPPKSAVAYYGGDIPYSLVGVHDYIILQPDHVNTHSHGFDLYKEAIYAYVSIGEGEKGQPYFDKLDPSWVIGENKIWGAKVMDISNSAYQDFLFKQLFDPLIAKGFKNFFFDTLDSYHLGADTVEKKEKMQEGLIRFIHAFRLRYPKAKLILNRGFEVIDAVHSEVEAVLFESLFYGLSHKDLSYTEVSQGDREWLLAQVKKIQSYNKPVIAIDYLPLDEHQKIRETMGKIEALGIIPYIGDGGLQRIGQSSKEVIKREVLILYNDREYEGTDNDDKMFSTGFRQISMPLEYMGYVPVMQPITTWKFSPVDSDRYAGAVVWMSGKDIDNHAKILEEKLMSLLSGGIKVLLLESINATRDHRLLEKLQIGASIQKENGGKLEKNLLQCKKEMFDFEIAPYYVDSGYRYTPPKGSQTLCDVTVRGEKSTIGAITPWGGYLLEGAVMAYVNQNDLWVMNPFEVLRQTLRLPSIPVPDPTTENGRRLLFSHIDGDGFTSRAEWDGGLFASEVLYEEIFKQYPIPISFSTIEGEIAPHGIYPKDSKHAQEVAKKIYALENIEAATHTFSHPFFWRKVTGDALEEDYRLKIKNYEFSVDREIRGSLEYINTHLVPKGKEAKVLFWSGDCRPTQENLEYIHENNFLQINGGETTITKEKPWIANIAPLGVKRGDHYQIYTGAQNENVYTNNWLGPYWGFRRVIQTFEMTESPKRLKPIDIYYHTYSGSKKASLNALHAIYKWAMKQSVLPIYTSEYVPKVMDFYEASIAKTAQGWYVKGMRSLRTLRLDSKEGVDFESSVGVAGEVFYQNQHYIHLDGRESHQLNFAHTPQDQNYLVDANGIIKGHRRDGKGESLELSSHFPLAFGYHLAKGCTLITSPKEEMRKVEDGESGVIRVEYRDQKDANVTAICK